MESKSNKFPVGLVLTTKEYLTFLEKASLIFYGSNDFMVGGVSSLLIPICFTHSHISFSSLLLREAEISESVSVILLFIS